MSNVTQTPSAPFTLKEKVLFATVLGISFGTPAACMVHDFLTKNANGWFMWWMIGILGLIITFTVVYPIVVTSVAIWRRHGPSIFLAAVGWGTIGIWAGIMAGLYTFGFLDKLMDSWGGLGHLLLSAPFLWVSMKCFARLGTETSTWWKSRHEPHDKKTPTTLPHPRF